MEDNSAAAMIRRFREGKPTSREERAKAKQATGVDKLWYENDVDMPRSLAVEPSVPPSRPREALRSARQPTDFMTESSSSLFKGTRLGETTTVDDMIEKEIQQLQNELMERDRRTDGRLNLGSYRPTRDLDLRSSLGSTRDSTGGYRLGGRSLRGELSPMRQSGDLLRSSVETLGSTGFRGLLTPHLKLDGKKEEEKPKEEKTAEQMAELNKNLEAFLQSMRAEHPPKNPYFPEGVDETIGQITNKVHNDMLDFKNLFGDRHTREDDEAKAQKEQDELMREEGRKQAREKQLLELDLPASHPLEYLGVWDGQQQYPGMVAPSAVPYLQQPYPSHPYAPQGFAQQPPGVHAPQTPLGAVGAAHPPAGAHIETDLAALRVSDDSSVGSPFPQYKSTILSPELSAGLPSIPEGFAVGNAAAAAPGPAAAAGPGVPPSGPVAMAPSVTGEAPTTPAAATAAAVVPTLLSAGVLAAHGSAPQTRVHPGQLVAAAAPAMGGAPTGYPVKGFAQGVGLMQAAVDVEMSAADEVLHKMRALRTQLGMRVRHLDALHGSLIPAPADYRPTTQQPSAPMLPLYARPAGPPPAPMYPPGGPQLVGAGGRAPYGYLYGPGAGVPPQYWGLEQYYLAQEQARLEAIARPPELLHMDVYGVSKGVTAMLDSTIARLNAELPPPTLNFKFSLAPKISPTLEEATAAAATKIITSPRPEAKTAPSPAPGATPKGTTPAPTPTPVEPSTPTPTPAPAAAPATAPADEHKATAAAAVEGEKKTVSLAPLVAPVEPAPTTTTTAAPAAPAAVEAATPKPEPVTPKAEAATTEAKAAPAEPTAAPAAAKSSIFAKLGASKSTTGTTATTATKTPKELLSEMDRVLGKEDRTSNYLARDLQPSEYAAGPTTLKGTDAYLRAHYGPGAWEPRAQYAQRVRPGEPTIIRAPSEAELRERYGGEFSGLSVQSAAIASAPPAIFEHTALHRAPSPQRTAVGVRFDLQPPIGSGPAPLPTYVDPRRAVDAVAAYPPRRPVEGAALEYLRSNQIGIVQTESGRKYVNPFSPSTTGSYTSSDSRTTLIPSVQYIPPDLRTKEPASAAYGARNMPSPTSVAVHEKEVFLKQMRQLRHNLLST